MKCFILLFTFLLGVYCHAFAQEWHLYNTSNSLLPDNQVQAIAIDKQNVKWIGTANGLARFDGTKWNIYTKGNSALPSSVITAITTDTDGNIWIGTDKGLAKFNGLNWLVYTAGNSVLANDAITTIACDQTSGNLWIGTEKGLIKYDGVNWIRFDDTNSGLINDFICSIAIDRSGKVWVGTFDHFQFAGQLYSYDGTNWLVTRLEQKGLNSSFPDVLVIDPENTIWMGIKGTMGGALVRIQESTWRIFNNQTSQHLNGGINSLVIEGNHKWIGSGGGLVSYYGNDFKKFDSSNSPLPDDFISTLAVDKKGIKWIGTIYGGLASYMENDREKPEDSADKADNLLSIYPNPVASFTTILYYAPQKENVTVSIYNSAGFLVEIIQNKVAEKGNHAVTWRPLNLTQGLYFCTIKRGEKTLTKKLLVK